MLLLLLGGCSLCQPTPWAELERAEDEDVGAVDAALAWATLDEFIRWSGREESCVRQVRLRSDYELVDDGLAASGSFRLASGRIEVSTAFGDVETQMRHELCHAVDHQDGTSDARPDLFPQGGVELPDDRVASSGEVYATWCEGGARDVGRWTLAQAQCDVEVTSLDLDALGEIQATAYASAPEPAWLDGAWPAVAGQAWAAPDTPEGLTGGWWSAGPEHVVRLLRHEDTEGRLRVERYAPETGALLGSEDIEACGEGAYYCNFRLLPGPDGPWLWTEGGDEPDQQRLWRLGAEGAAEPGAEGAEEPGAGGAVEQLTACERTDWDLVVQGVLWRLEYSWETQAGGVIAMDARLQGCEVATGASQQLLPPEPGFPRLAQHVSWSEPMLVAMAGEPALWWPDGGLSWPDPSHSRWTELELPWHLDLEAPASLPDGGLLFGVVTTDIEASVLHLVRVDPDGSLQAIDPGCAPVTSWEEGDRLLQAGEGWAVLEERHEGTRRFQPVTWQ